MIQTRNHERSPPHPTPDSTRATTVAVDLAKEVFELTFADDCTFS